MMVAAAYRHRILIEFFADKEMRRISEMKIRSFPEWGPPCMLTIENIGISSLSQSTPL